MMRSVSERCLSINMKRMCCAHNVANQDHLDVAEHLRDNKDDA